LGQIAPTIRQASGCGNGSAGRADSRCIQIGLAGRTWRTAGRLAASASSVRRIEGWLLRAIAVAGERHAVLEQDAASASVLALFVIVILAIDGIVVGLGEDDLLARIEWCGRRRRWTSAGSRGSRDRDTRQAVEELLGALATQPDNKADQHPRAGRGDRHARGAPAFWPQISPAAGRRLGPWSPAWRRRRH
jgi:hypothetical protein